MYEFFGWLAVYALWRMRGDVDPQVTNVAPMSDGAFAVLSFIFGAVGWGFGVWLIWSIL
jgi:hypothetical protein